MTLLRRLLFLATLLNSLNFAQATADSFFICNELLTKPTTNSICINACTGKSVQAFCEYGTDSLNYALRSDTVTSQESVPFNFSLKSLQPNTLYFYRIQYKLQDSTKFKAKVSHHFHTARLRGSPYTFAIEADPHMDTNSVAAVYSQTLKNMQLSNPDFLLDLGDTFMSEKLPTQNPTEILKRHLYLRSFFDISCHSLPLFLVQGNHDGELGWLVDTTANNVPVWNTTLRKKYYPNPEPDSFYTGNSIPEKYVGLRQNYYSWQWGDALFVVLDPYWYTVTKPGWGWTLGNAQYMWLKNTLSSSTAKFKFVFCHQLVGGNGTDGRGGIEYADFYEMGGKNTDSTWGWDTYRTNWGKPIHSLFIDNKVDIFFHGHDHFYGKQDKDGVVYQEVPQPSLKQFQNSAAASYGYVNGTILPNRGYLKVTITSDSAKIEYIRTYLSTEENSSRHNLDVSHSYVITKTGTTSIVSEPGMDVKDFTVYQNFPNPFNPSTQIRYQIVSGTNVSVRIYNSLGQEVQTLINTFQEPGLYSLTFKPQELQLSSGTYYCRIASGLQSKVIKMMYLK
jgi:predicted phosphodiesterase